MGYRGGTHFQQRKLEAAFARADREAALRKQDWRCKYCFCKLTYKNATRDHVECRVDGGSNDKSNIVAACFRCNQVKGRLPVKKFIRYISAPLPGEPYKYLMIHVDRRLNTALMNMEARLLQALGKKTWF